MSNTYRMTRLSMALTFAAGLAGCNDLAPYPTQGGADRRSADATVRGAAATRRRRRLPLPTEDQPKPQPIAAKEAMTTRRR